MRALLTPAVTSSDRSTPTPYTESLQPPQIHPHYKCFILSLTKIPFIPLLNLYQSTHSNLFPFCTSRCPSMMVSIIEIVLYSKPTAEHQHLLRSSRHPLHTKRVFPFILALTIRRICSSNENRKIQRVHTITHTHTSDSPTRIPLVVGYHPAIHSIHPNTFTFSHPHNFVLLRINKLEIRSEPELLINVMVLYTVQSPPFFRKIVENERYRQPSSPGLA